MKKNASHLSSMFDCMTIEHELENPMKVQYVFHYCSLDFNEKSHHAHHDCRPCQPNPYHLGDTKYHTGLIFSDKQTYGIVGPDIGIKVHLKITCLIRASELASPLIRASLCQSRINAFIERAFSPHLYITLCILNSQLGQNSRSTGQDLKVFLLYTFYKK